MTIYGGVSAQPQIQGLRGWDIVVACPGRLLDLIGQRAVNLNIEILVLDEADQMFDMGFLPAIRRIIRAACPKAPDAAVLCHHARRDRALARELLRRPVTVELGASRPVETVGHAVYPVEQTRKLDLLLALLTQPGSRARCWSLPAPSTAPRSSPAAGQSRAFRHLAAGQPVAEPAPGSDGQLPQRTG
jgi:ATP-dependent RNA helicase RhlE